MKGGALLIYMAIAITAFILAVLYDSPDSTPVKPPTADVCLPVGGGDPNLEVPA